MIFFLFFSFFAFFSSVFVDTCVVMVKKEPTCGSKKDPESLSESPFHNFQCPDRIPTGQTKKTSSFRFSSLTKSLNRAVSLEHVYSLNPPLPPRNPAAETGYHRPSRAPIRSCITHLVLTITPGFSSPLIIPKKLFLHLTPHVAQVKEK